VSGILQFFRDALQGARQGPSRGDARAAGFTLVEILVTVVVLAVGIVAVLEALQNSVTALDASRENLTAHRIIAEKLSEFEEQALSRGGLRQGSQGGRELEPHGEYLWQAAVRRVAELPEMRVGQRTVRESVSEVTVKVRRSGSGRWYSLSVYLRSAEQGS
jgi:prepilin-type N-terminal cleavage/methylation domain-containing protein